MIRRYFEFDPGAITFLAVDDERGSAALQVLLELLQGPVHMLGDKRVLLSYLFPNKIAPEELARYDVKFNFHPAPLPDYRGFAPYTWGILHQEKTWAVTCHHMTDEIDAGGIVHMERFDIQSPDTVTAEGLRDQTAPVLLNVFHRVVGEMLTWGRFGAGTPYYTRKTFEKERLLQLPENTPEMLRERYRRAFYCPPHKGFNEE